MVKRWKRSGKPTNWHNEQRRWERRKLWAPKIVAGSLPLPSIVGSCTRAKRRNTAPSSLQTANAGGALHRTRAGASIQGYCRPDGRYGLPGRPRPDHGVPDCSHVYLSYSIIVQVLSSLLLHRWTSTHMMVTHIASIPCDKNRPFPRGDCCLTQ